MSFRVLCIGSSISIGLFMQAARGEVYEVRLPVTGTYAVRDLRDFDVDFGTAFSEIREARFFVEGTMVAPLSGPFWLPPYRPLAGFFQAKLDQGSSTLVLASGPPAGEDTYPAPEAFAGEGVFAAVDPIDWHSLLDGKVEGHVMMASGRVCCNDSVVGGTGVITRASLILDATPVPEPGALGLAVVGAAVQLRRRRRA